MKSVLAMMTVGFLATSVSSVSNTFTNSHLISFANNNLKYNKTLSVNPIKQENKVYCLPASIQMLFAFLSNNQIDLNTYNQTRIFNDLDGVPGGGVEVSDAIASYINGIIEEYAPLFSSYHVNELWPGYINTISGLRMFEQYVVQSIDLGAPLIFAADLDRFNHAYVINGVNVNADDPEATTYSLINPGDGRTTIATVDQLRGISWRETHLIGMNSNFDFANKEIKMTGDIEPIRATGISDNISNNVFNMTKTAGIVDINQMRNFRRVYDASFDNEIYYDGGQHHVVLSDEWVNMEDLTHVNNPWYHDESKDIIFDYASFWWYSSSKSWTSGTSVMLDFQYRSTIFYDLSSLLTENFTPGTDWYLVL